MCGFAGFVERHGRPPADRAKLLRAMGAELARRGPDDEVVHDDGALAFVFRRLSIVDLATGAQPIWNEPRTRFVAVNGEIYNHRALRRALRAPAPFRTESDAEIVLHLYEERGPAALEALIGKFALVVWDAAEQRLFLARDRVGVKPLYYVANDGLFLFGSELKALLAHPACPRGLRWADLREARFAGGLSTFVEGIEQLPGGHCATYQRGRFETRAYWSIDRFFPGPGRAEPPADVAGAYAEILADSVELRLMSDVPIAGFLSGGVDSALVMALAARSRPGLHAFQVVERTTMRCGDAASARAIAEAAGLTLHPVIFDHRTILDQIGFDLGTLEYFVWLLDSPRFDLEWFFKHELHRYAKSVLPGVKVMLLGQGADEFAGGYSQSYDGPSGGLEEYVRRVGASARLEAIDRAGVPAELVELLGDDHPFRGAGTLTFHDEMSRRIGALQNFNLWHEDRTAAAQGIEARVPFLDHRLLELCASIPAGRQEELFFDKRIVRDAARRHLPEAIAARRKIGFYHTHDTSSIDALYAEMVRRVYPAFDESYLGRQGALFSRRRVGELFARIACGGATGQEAARRVVQVMCVAIFERLCSRSGEGPPAGLDPPSPLEEAAAPPASWGPAVDVAVSFRPEARVALEADVELLRPLGSGAGSAADVSIVRAGKVEERLSIEEDTRWMLGLLEILAGSQEGAAVGDVARRLAVPIEQLAQGLTLLWERRWLRVDPAAC